jgi:hypothetical protein
MTKVLVTGAVGLSAHLTRRLIDRTGSPLHLQESIAEDHDCSVAWVEHNADLRTGHGEKGEEISPNRLCRPAAGLHQREAQPSMR